MELSRTSCVKVINGVLQKIEKSVPDLDEVSRKSAAFEGAVSGLVIGTVHLITGDATGIAIGLAILESYRTGKKFGIWE